MKREEMPVVKVVIPAYNEAEAIGKVIQDIPSLVNEIVVIDNASTDATAQVAKQAGATVLNEHKKGYGYACLRGIDYLKTEGRSPEILVFLDGDYSDYPQELIKLIDPIIAKKVDFALGARTVKKRAKGSMTPQQIFGNALACFLMRKLYHGSFTDLGPFRAIRWDSLMKLNMQDKTYGWTIEMQLKILRHNISYVEIPVSYKQRIGISKVSGTIKGTIFAGMKIIGWIFKHYFS